MDGDKEPDEDWRLLGESVIDHDWALAGISEPSHWPSDVSRQEIWEGCREDQSFDGEDRGQKEQSRSMAGKATVT